MKIAIGKYGTAYIVDGNKKPTTSGVFILAATELLAIVQKSIKSESV